MQIDQRVKRLEAMLKPSEARTLDDFYIDMATNPNFIDHLYPDPKKDNHQ